MIVPAILEHEEIQGISSRGRMGSLSRDLDSPVTNYKPSDLLSELTNHHKVIDYRWKLLKFWIT